MIFLTIPRRADVPIYPIYRDPAVQCIFPLKKSERGSIKLVIGLDYWLDILWASWMGCHLDVLWASWMGVDSVTDWVTSSVALWVFWKVVAWENETEMTMVGPWAALMVVQWDIAREIPLDSTRVDWKVQWTAYHLEFVYRWMD